MKLSNSCRYCCYHQLVLLARYESVRVIAPHRADKKFKHGIFNLLMNKVIIRFYSCIINDIIALTLQLPIKTVREHLVQLHVLTLLTILYRLSLFAINLLFPPPSLQLLVFLFNMYNSMQEALSCECVSNMVPSHMVLVVRQHFVL